MAVPGTNGFIGELLVLSGTFGVNNWAASAGVLGALLGATYILGLYRQMLLGPVSGPTTAAKMWDLNKRELCCAVPLLVFIFWLGLYPKPFLSSLQPTISHLLGQTVGAAYDGVAG